MEAWQHAVTSVSYTHLDVYKRQILSCSKEKVKERQIGGKYEENIWCIECLSLIHIWLYRQILFIRGFRCQSGGVCWSYRLVILFFVFTNRNVTAVSYTHLDVYKRQRFHREKSICYHTYMSWKREYQDKKDIDTAEHIIFL